LLRIWQAHEGSNLLPSRAKRCAWEDLGYKEKETGGRLEQPPVTQLSGLSQMLVIWSGIQY